MEKETAQYTPGGDKPLPTLLVQLVAAFVRYIDEADREAPAGVPEEVVRSSEA